MATDVIDVESEPLKEAVVRRLALLMREGTDYEGARYVRPLQVSVSWGKLMSAVLVGNLLTAVIVWLIYDTLVH